MWHLGDHVTGLACFELDNAKSYPSPCAVSPAATLRPVAMSSLQLENEGDDVRVTGTSFGSEPV